MSAEVTISRNSFISGGGEMGALTRAKDWAQTSLGSIDTWPQSLKTTLSIVLHSRFPMFLFWGPDLICFYNDAYRPSLGREGKHPHMLGMPGKEAWPEIWPVIYPIISQVLKGGEASWNEDQLIPIFRNGHIEDVYWTFSYSPVIDENEVIAGVFVTCTESTEKLLAQKKLEHSERNFRSLVLESPLSAAVFRTREFIIEIANDAALSLWGKDQSIIGKAVVDVFPELKNQPYLQILRDVYETGITYEGEENRALLNRNGLLQEVFVTFIYKALRDERGSITGILCMGYDVTEQVRSKNLIGELEERSRLALDANDIGVYDSNLRTGKTIFSEKMHQLYGSDLPLPDEAYTEMIHPDDKQRRKAALAEALQTGKLEYEYRILLPNGSVRWMESHAKVYYGKEGLPERRIGTVQDITRQKTLLSLIESTEKKFRDMVMQAPVGIVLLMGEEFLVEMANKNYLDLVDRREDSFVGRPLFDSLPEVKSSVEPLLLSVLRTGVPYTATDFPVTLNRYKKADTAYFNLIYQPFLAPDGTITGVMAIATEVTSQVSARHAIRERESKFSYLLMNAPVAMTTLTVPDFTVEIANSTMLNRIWHKQEQEVAGRKIFDVFPELADQPIAQWLRQVQQEGRSLHEQEAALALVVNGQAKTMYLDIEFAPLFGHDGTVSSIMVTASDVTEAITSKRLLENAEERLRLAADGTGIATWDLDLKSRRLIYSPRLAEMFSQNEEMKVSHEDLRARVHPEDISLVESAFAEALQSGLYFYQARVLMADGSYRWIATKGKVYFDEQHKPVRMLGTTRDINEEKINEEKIARLAAIVRSSSDAIVSKRLDGIVTSWNDAAVRMFGYTEEEMVGQHITRIIPADKLDEELHIIERLRRGQGIDHMETRRITRDGRHLWVSLSISPLTDVHNRVIGASKIIRDITEQQQAQLLMKQSEEKFRLLADSLPQLVWIADRHGLSTYLNKTFVDYSGTTADQLRQAGWVELIHPDDLRENEIAWERSVLTGEPFLLGHRLRRKDGEYRWQLSRALPQKDEAGNITMWIGSSTDIDDIKKHDQQKDDFIKMASHELKTPVTTIRGYVQLLLKMTSDGKNPFLANSLQTIDRQIFKLTKLITDLLDVSKIETGSLILRKEAFPVAEMAREIAEELQTTAQTHRILVKAEASPVIYADPDRIAQVFINLITNAIKYSPGSDEVQVHIGLQGDNCLVSVSDTGIGISKIDQPRIFERFYRVAGKHENTFPGFGIGLFIVNEIVTLHQGRTWVESEKEKGSVFYVLLPLKEL